MGSFFYTVRVAIDVLLKVSMCIMSSVSPRLSEIALVGSRKVSRLASNKDR